MAKARTVGRFKKIKVVPADETIVQIDEIRIVCVVQNSLTGDLTLREITVGLSGV